ncbi:MAG: Valyl-tRNA synthetase [Parcubacteria group bacterium GW2011_GWC1_42_11]|uniref:Valine--tRNA ligase n=1 Tax=Candidatus Nomurabacteria bacterium GW2011_GWC2_42_20 TaxID=1618756 RepID=A0A0G1BN83_9BACT|nr:MAG: Valyl-tRNA synthetase [Parcubacteria group bacterium GW2011_GWC1_42_11]KKS47731.1 MAG: Valyl-tRNA synthetase [Candidatus Nomurabacteria bacterium GW2011_GWC2_42_20]KKT08632.1 MAG: Valyl-tRNA synthetase [Candidatus Nomurabacteria bacterium GW2011_GWB1_43_20]TAN36374.1 MAG: valine--tRNA ligase [Patescibacteria group bacterium]HBH71626.1 valine--tRNA ligase [Candidatus Yonathbacteria bacterium]
MTTIPEKLTKPYEPANTESRIYKLWEESGFFNPDNLPERHKEPFTIIMPPPNANGRLHAGHGLTIALEDIMTRYQRMQGKKALWVPGADHAGFETQVVYEKKLEKEGRSRFKMDRKELYDEIMAFTLESKKHMEADVKALGASCDWSREKFTLDPNVVSEVQETFRKLYRDGLVYRGYRTVNWCTKHQTSLSDVETENVEKADKLYYIKYGPFVVATVRPETIFGDVAIAVNPSDARYKNFIGQTIEVQHPENKLSLIVIGDEEVDPEFGTGALKITPAHDHNDFRMSETHKLPRIEVIDQFGKLNEKTGKYAGMKIADARTKVVEDLQALGLIEKIEDYTHTVPTCYKCSTTIEPRVMPQWFVKMAPLAKLAGDAVRDGKVKFIPDNFEKIFLYWMDNTIDWNISRQIVWGIQIPALICAHCNAGALDTEHKEGGACPTCGKPLSTETDTFDTWFSSGQWPLLALGYPEKADLGFYPTDVMETGRDLIFKWVPRMVIFGLYIAKQVPFHNVYMHGMVNDKLGKKMSKSKGNVVSPIELTDKYGADALRIGLVIGNTPGNDIALAEDKIKGYKHFCNKIWNATRFVLTNIGDTTLDTPRPALIPRDEEILAEFNTALTSITSHYENFRFHLAGEELYHYFWNTFADIIIEEMKPRLVGNDQTSRNGAQWVLLQILSANIKMLHPFIPFITEEIWGILPREQKSLLIIEPWPKPF